MGEPLQVLAKSRDAIRVLAVLAAAEPPDVYDVLLESATIEEARVSSQMLVDAGCSYDVLGANRELAGAEVELVDVERREKRLRQAIAEVASQ